MAFTPASLMCWGVSKSGCPRPKLMDPGPAASKIRRMPEISIDSTFSENLIPSSPPIHPSLDVHVPALQGLDVDLLDLHEPRDDGVGEDHRGRLKEGSQGGKG